MTLDEAILHAREKAREKMLEYENHYDKDEHYYPRQCKRCAEEHEQLAEWLEELKFIRQWKSDIMDEFCKYDCNSIEEVYKRGYGKALFDIKAKMKEINNVTKPVEGVIENGWGTRFVDLAYINKITEQLKVGVENE